jgi:hypothetical protein
LQTEIVCRNCGHVETASVPADQQDVLTVGMLERRCPGCGRETRWGRKHDSRRKERRSRERRQSANTAPAERRNQDRRGARRRGAGF